MLLKHPSHFDLKLSILYINLRNKNLLSLNIPSSLGTTISADDDNASGPDSLCMPSFDDIPDEHTAPNDTAFSAESRDNLYKNTEDTTSDSDNVSDTSSTSSDEYLDTDT